MTTTENVIRISPVWTNSEKSFRKWHHDARSGDREDDFYMSTQVLTRSPCVLLMTSKSMTQCITELCRCCTGTRPVIFTSPDTDYVYGNIRVNDYAHSYGTTAFDMNPVMHIHRYLLYSCCPDVNALFGLKLLILWNYLLWCDIHDDCILIIHHPM